LGLGFGFRLWFRISGHVTRTRQSKRIILVTWPIQAIGFS